MGNRPNRMFDEFAKFITNAACTAKSLSQEAETAWSSWIEARLAGLDLVRRDEFEMLKALTQKNIAEREALTRRIDMLERQLNREVGNEPEDLDIK